MDSEFNLLDEPWILVMRPNGEVEAVGIADALLRASEYHSITGELASQNIAVLRLLLAILHTVISRCETENGRYVEDAREGIRIWSGIWNRGCFPEEDLKEYFENWRDRFYLFDEKRPFFQVARLSEEGAAPSFVEAGKLNGEISGSANKPRLFLMKDQHHQNELGYAEAARWLVHLMAFDDTSGKPQKKSKFAVGKMESLGTGWVGELGTVYAKGRNLFETLMLNLVLFPASGEPYGDEKPEWEREEARCEQRTKIEVPDNLSQLYTLQSRRILLQRQEKIVTGYLYLGGDTFDKENAFIEPMTVWRKNDKSGGYSPKRHDPARQIWRETELIFTADGGRNPGVLMWLQKIAAHRDFPIPELMLRTVTAKYGAQNSNIAEIAGDGMRISNRLLKGGMSEWARSVINQSEIVELLAARTRDLAGEIALASGGDGEVQKERAKQRIYSLLDMPFRRWMDSLDQFEEPSDAEDAFWEEARKIVLRHGREMVSAASEKAMTGRKVKGGKSESKKSGKNKSNAEERYVSAPDAYNKFEYHLKDRQTLRYKGGK